MDGGIFEIRTDLDDDAWGTVRLWKDQHLSIRVLVDKFQSKNQIRTKIAVEIIVLILSIAVFIVGGIMVTANSAGQISAALKLPMQVYYVCIPISGCLMVLYCLERLKDGSQN